MHRDYSIKETVKVLTVTKQKQKIRFQIRHPENAESIIGIAVTSNLIDDNPGFGQIGEVKSNTAGHLALSIPQKGDIVFGDDVKVDNNTYSDLTEELVYNLKLDISQAGKRDYYFHTLYKIDKAVLEGYYEDLYSPELNNADGIPKPYLYKIRIYIRYQMKSIVPKEETK